MIENDYYDFNEVTPPEEYADDVKNFIVAYAGLEKAKGYKLAGVRDFQGLKISVEHNKGGVRTGVDKDGHEWKIKMHYAYGGIRGTRGNDGDYVDCYLGDNDSSRQVFIVHQNDPITHKYDEDKVMLGFNSAEEAKKAYMKQYDRPGFFGSMDETDMDHFKEMLKTHKGVKLKKSITITPEELMKAYNSASTMTVTGTECTFKEFLKPFLEYIQKIGGSGHSFSIIVDPDDSENKKVFGFDGDGADRIDTIKVVTPVKKSGDTPGLPLYKIEVLSPVELLKGLAGTRGVPDGSGADGQGCTGQGQGAGKERLNQHLKQKGTYVEGQPKIFTAEQAQQGIRVEMEHTDNVEVAKQIAYDHLAENPDYYSYLEEMEAQMEARKSGEHKLVLNKSKDSKVEKYKKVLLDFLQGKEELKKGKSYPTGTIREWQGKNYKKMANGKWMQYYEGKSGTKGMGAAVRNTVKKIRNATTMEELAEIVKNNSSRFKGADGRTAEIVKDLMTMARDTEAGAKKKGKALVEVRSDTPGNEKWTVTKEGKKFDVNKTKNGWRVAESGGGAPSIIGSKFVNSPEEATQKHIDGLVSRDKKKLSISEQIKQEYKVREDSAIKKNDVIHTEGAFKVLSTDDASQFVVTGNGHTETVMHLSNAKTVAKQLEESSKKKKSSDSGEKNEQKKPETGKTEKLKAQIKEAEKELGKKWSEMTDKEQDKYVDLLAPGDKKPQDSIKSSGEINPKSATSEMKKDPKLKKQLKEQGMPDWNLPMKELAKEIKTNSRKAIFYNKNLRKEGVFTDGAFMVTDPAFAEVLYSHTDSLLQRKKFTDGMMETAPVNYKAVTKGIDPKVKDMKVGGFLQAPEPDGGDALTKANSHVMKFTDPADGVDTFVRSAYVSVFMEHYGNNISFKSTEHTHKVAVFVEGKSVGIIMGINPDMIGDEYKPVGSIKKSMEVTMDLLAPDFDEKGMIKKAMPDTEIAALSQQLIW